MVDDAHPSLPRRRTKLQDKSMESAQECSRGNGSKHHELHERWLAGNLMVVLHRRWYLEPTTICGEDGKVSSWNFKRAKFSSFVENMGRLLGIWGTWVRFEGNNFFLIQPDLLNLKWTTFGPKLEKSGYFVVLADLHDLDLLELVLTYAPSFHEEVHLYRGIRSTDSNNFTKEGEIIS
jgi:hypothetical protein